MDGRDIKGRFTPGNKISPGRAPRAREAARLAILNEIVTEDKWRAVIEVALADAIAGADGQTREKGRRFLADYIIGKPVERVAIVDDRDPIDDEDLSHYTDEELRALAEQSAGSISGAGATQRGAD